MHASEELITTQVVALRTGLTKDQVRSVVKAYRALGLHLHRPKTHVDVHLPVVRGIPSVLEGDK